MCTVDMVKGKLTTIRITGNSQLSTHDQRTPEQESREYSKEALVHQAQIPVVVNIDVRRHQIKPVLHAGRLLVRGQLVLHGASTSWYTRPKT